MTWSVVASRVRAQDWPSKPAWTGVRSQMACRTSMRFHVEACVETRSRMSSSVGDWVAG